MNLHDGAEDPLTRPGAATGRRRRQLLIWSIGIVVTVVMVGLGLWQARAFQADGHDDMVARMTAAPRPWVDVVADERGVQSAFGAPVSVRGRYLDDQQVLAGPQPPYRVVTALELSDGRVLPVVRGLTTADELPEPQTEEVELIGILLPTDADGPTAAPTAGVIPGEGFVDAGSSTPPSGPAADELSSPHIDSVRLPVLAQSWPQAMPGAYLTVDGDSARADGLEPAIVAVPDTAPGRARNQGYALQWWIFALVALAATVKLSRDAATNSGFMTFAPRAEQPTTREDA